MANPQWRLQSDAHESTIWAIKISFCFLGIVSFGAATRAAVPATAAALYSALPGLRAFLRSWFSPQYLFVAVHFMILAIWKLSDRKQQPQSDRWSATEPGGDPIKIKSFVSAHSYELNQKCSPVIHCDEISLSSASAAISSSETSSSNISCLTLDSVESSTASSKKAIELDPKRCITEEEDKELVTALETAGMENDSMEVTWKAITEKSSQASAWPEPAPAPPSSFSGDDDLTQRFEDFIKKNHEQIRFSIFEGCNSTLPAPISG
ncbi:uncharacterized protein LOC122054243 [Zingiber officinale]|uniref:uncharacterized protein LOC122054243 n=1 Tax=Zingiber officinale TaxID=94328 RepID=UPI001C4CB817|nr:uncharacterized protein LOC122054243 [Zingiber officinale]